MAIFLWKEMLLCDKGLSLDMLKIYRKREVSTRVGLHGLIVLAYALTLPQNDKF